MEPRKPLGSSNLDAELRVELEALARAGRLRDVHSRPDGLVDFTSNDYLGLASHGRVIEAAREACELHGAGGRAARLLGGGAGHAELERLGAEWLGEQAALFFPTGYQANLGLLTSLAGDGDVVFSAAANHASIIDGLRLSKARVVIFDHGNPDDLERKLRDHGPSKRRIVAVEGIYSMGGDRPPLEAIDALCQKYDAHLVVDEAHSVGVVGPGCRGAAAGLKDDPNTRLVARTITGGKALGSGGALVVGSRAVIDVLLNSFIFTTAATPGVCASFAAAIRVVQDSSELAERARAGAADLAKKLGLPVPDAAILSVLLGDENVAVKASEQLLDLGFDVRAVRPPTVPVGTSRLRIVAHAFNGQGDRDGLVRALKKCGVLAKIQAPGPAPEVKLAPALVIAGTDTDVGKTVAAALCTRALKLRGKVHFWKPVQTGDDSDSETVARLAGLDGHEVLRPAWELPLPASPHEAAIDAGVSIEAERIGAALLSLRKTLPESRIVVELAGGLMVPYAISEEAGVFSAELQVDWLRRTGAPFVLVARSGLGTLNHTLLSLEALRTRHLVPRAILLLGHKHESNAATLRELANGIPLLQVPRFEQLEVESIDRWLGDPHGDGPRLGELLVHE